MQDLFSGTNPNDKIFNIPTQQGSDPDDKRHSMIGDAALKHASTLGNNRLLVDNYLHFANGNIFRMEPNPIHNVDKPEPDEIIVSQETKSGDIFDLGTRIDKDEDSTEESILFADYIPSTPKPLFIYAGNSKEIFYDEFPAGHPNEKHIKIFLMMIRNNINEFYDPFIASNGKKYKQWHLYFKDIVGKWEHFELIDSDVTNEMIDTIEYIAYNYPSEDSIRSYLSDMLLRIDKEHSAEVRFLAISNTLLTNKAYAYLLKKEHEIDAGILKGDKSKLIKEIGKELFIKGGSILGDCDKITKARKMAIVWNKYRTMKNKYAPKVMIGGYDINKCYHLSTLIEQVGLSELQAKKVKSYLINKSKFYSTSEVLRLIGANNKELTSREERKIVRECLNIIDNGAENAVKLNKKGMLLSVPAKFIVKQKRKELVLSSDGWKIVWEHYRSTKNDTMKQLETRG